MKTSRATSHFLNTLFYLTTSAVLDKYTFNLIKSMETTPMKCSQKP